MPVTRFLHRYRAIVALALLALAVVELAAIAVSSYANATRRHVEIGVASGDVIVRVYLNCQLVRGYDSRTLGVERVDLGWLRPDDIVSTEIFSTGGSGYFKVTRRIDAGRMVTLGQRGRRGRGAELPHHQLVLRRAFLATGASLDAIEGDAPSCAIPPRWAFAPPAGTDPGASPGRPSVAYDIAGDLRPAGAWLLGAIGLTAFLFAIFAGRELSHLSRYTTAGVAAAQFAILVLASQGLKVPGLATVCVVAGLIYVGLFLDWLLREDIRKFGRLLSRRRSSRASPRGRATRSGNTGESGMHRGTRGRRV